MRTFKLAIALAALLIAVPASALDMCFSGCSEFVVVKQYKAPSKGRCRNVAAYEASTATPYLGTGTVCRNAVGDKLRVMFTIARLASDETIVLDGTLPYPSLTGGNLTRQTIQAAGTGINCFAGGLFSASACVPAPLP